MHKRLTKAQKAAPEVVEAPPGFVCLHLMGVNNQPLVFRYNDIESFWWTDNGTRIKRTRDLSAPIVVRESLAEVCAAIRRASDGAK